MMMMATPSFVLALIFLIPTQCIGLSNLLGRRSIILSAPSATLAGGLLPSTDLATRLASKDPSVLENNLFNIPPSLQVYPKWLRGNWRVESRFAGFLLPSKTIPKEQVVANPTVAGFQKCSIANLADIGKERITYDWSVDTATGWEDRASTLPSQINSYLGYKAVQSVTYNPQRNPNRLAVQFVEYRTINAERIEIFCNARESYESDDLFVCAEYVKQVTFGTGSSYGVPRQVVTNYANFWTWRTNGSGNLLTAAYLDPQDPLYFSEPKRPVVMYSHQLQRQAV